MFLETNEHGFAQPINASVCMHPFQAIHLEHFLIPKIEMPIINTSPTMTKWFSGMVEAVTRCKEDFSSSVLAGICGSALGLIKVVLERVLFAAFTFTLVLGGSIIGIIAGAIRGQTTEAGFLDGAGKGALTGAIAAIELINYAAIGEPLSEVTMLSSFLNGKVFIEWICPAAAHAYELHINTPETSYREVSDIYDIGGVKGMPQNFILNLPFQQYNSSKMLKIYNKISCSICLKDFEDGELVRILPKCGHIFHLECIDKWLIRQGSCPMCRSYVPDHIHEY